jgi:hypothetical protein
VKAEVILASVAMALFGVIVAVVAANALAPPERSAAAPRQVSPPPPPAQSVAVQQPTHTPAEATALASIPADARARDERRRADLAGLQAGLREYRDKKGDYPSTGGSVQTACVYEKLDKLCAIKGFKGVANFVDPRGQLFGYYYASDGKSYALYASLEGDNAGSDPCPGDLSVFKNLQNLYCVTSARSD